MAFSLVFGGRSFAFFALSMAFSAIPAIPGIAPETAVIIPFGQFHAGDIGPMVMPGQFQHRAARQAIGLGQVNIHLRAQPEHPA